MCLLFLCFFFISNLIWLNKIKAWSLKNPPSEEEEEVIRVSSRRFFLLHILLNPNSFFCICWFKISSVFFLFQVWDSHVCKLISQEVIKCYKIQFVWRIWWKQTDKKLKKWKKNEAAAGNTSNLNLSKKKCTKQDFNLQNCCCTLRKFLIFYCAKNSCSH